jgi:multiple sugar transport system substrate-binding protein
MRRRATNRREFLQIGGAAFAGAVLLGGCGGSGGDGGGDDSIVTLAISPDLVDMMRGPLERFGRANDVTVKVRVMPSDVSQYYDRMRTQLQAGEADVDVIAGDVSWPAQFGANGWLADVTDRWTPELRAAYLPAAVEANTYEDRMFGLPFFTDVGLMWYRVDLLERAGYGAPPATWDELREIALRVTRDARLDNGLVFTGANYEGGTVLGLEFVRTSGGEVLVGDDVTATDPATVAGLELQRGLVTDGVSPASVANFQEDECTGAFLGGNAVFMRNWAYVFGMLGDREVSSLSPDQVAIAPVPVRDSSVRPTNVGGGWNLLINGASQKQDVAWKLAEFISAPEQQTEWALTGSYLPTLRALYDERAIVDRMPAVARAKEEIFETTTPPITPYYGDVSKVLSTEFNANLRGASSPSETADKLQSELEQIIERAS